ncbi:hypothetical protein Tco_0344166 [Tanacetum coccineum]
MTESSYRLDTTQDPRVNLEGTGGSQGDQVQSSNDRPHSGGNTSERAKGGLNLHVLHNTYTFLSQQVLDLQKAKDAQVVKDEKVGKKESASKQGRKNAKPGPNLDAFDDLDADLAHGMDYMETEEAMNEGMQINETEELNLDVDTEVIIKDKGSGEKGVTAMKEEKAKEKGVAFKDVEDYSRPVRSITTLKPLPFIDPKDKGKGILVEEEPVKIKRKDQGIDQIERDKELAHKLHKEELAEIARIQEEKAAQEETSRVAIIEMFDEVQAGIDADALFAAKLQQEEREEYTIEERAKFLARRTKLHQRIFRAHKQFNMGGYKHSQLKAKTFEEIQAMYERQKKKIDDFKPMDSDDAVKDSKKAAGEDISKKEEVLKELDSTKIESMNKEDTEERVFDVSKKRKGDKEGIIDYEVLEKRFPIINWESKFYHYDRHGAEGIYYRIFRSDGSSRWIKTFSEMVTKFDRLDLVELYNLVMQRFETITPEDVDLVLWGDLRTMFDANTEDELWQNQERWNLKSWNFYENCKVHTLTLEDSTEIHMLAERKYPLIKETLERMMSLKLIDESASDGAYDLLRFIQNQIDEAGCHDEGEKDL